MSASAAAVPALPKINGQTMKPLSPLSSTNPRSLARFRREVRPKIRKLPKTLYTQHFFKRFSLVAPAGLVPYPSSNTIDLAQVQTCRLEIAQTAEDEGALRRFMSGKSPEVCERQFEYACSMS